MLVEVRPLAIQKWHKKSGGEEDFTRPKVLEVLINTETGEYDTGLTDEQTVEYGKKLGADLSKTVDYDSPHPYWSTKPAWISLENRTMIFDTKRAQDFVKVANMKASKKVANSLQEWQDGKYPFATHVIFDESEELELKASKIAITDKAKKLAENLNHEAKAAVITILSEKHTSVRGQSANFVVVELNELIEKDPAKVVRTIEMGKEEVYLRAKILDLVDANIVNETMGSYNYMGEPLGLTYEDTVKWFQDPKNATMKVMMFEKLEKK